MSLNYEKIFTAIMENKAVDVSVSRDKNFYNYLLKNRIAYFYAKSLSSEKNEFERKIIEAGNKRNSLFYETLEYLDDFCKKYNISYLLYKTYKYFGEVIGGDIDVIVSEKDFSLLMHGLSDEGWDCIEDEPGKGKCRKNGYITIEPHTNISWNGNTFFSPHRLFEDTEEKYIHGRQYRSVHTRYEILSIYLKILYEPEYLDLYDYKVLRELGEGFEFDRIVDVHNAYYIKWLQKKIASIPENHIFPYFFSSGKILMINLVNLYHTRFFNKRMFIHNFYWKYRYMYNGKLPYLTSYIEF